MNNYSKQLIVLFQTPPSRPDMPALGLPYIQSALKAAGFGVTLCDLSLAIYKHADKEMHELFNEEFHSYWYSPLDGPALAMFEKQDAMLEKLIQDAIGKETMLIGLTVLATQKASALYFAEKIKKLSPDIPIVLGGPSCFQNYEPYELAASEWVDYVIVGEGEAAIVDLAHYIKAGAVGPLPPGILRNRGNDRSATEAGEPRQLLPNLDAIPFPDFNGLLLNDYTVFGRFPIMGSRGCIRHCVYCVEHLIWQRYRVRSAGNVLGEILDRVERLGAKSVEFNDSLLNGHPRILGQLCDGLIDAKAGVSWGGQAIIRKEMTPGLLEKMYNAGCRQLTYGLESASPLVLGLMGKPTDLKVISNVIKHTHEAGIIQKVNIMVGFPGETETEFQQTLDFLSRHADYIDEINPSDAFTGIIPGTELFKRAQDFGVCFVNNNHYFWETKDGSNTMAVRIERFEQILKLASSLGLYSSYGSDHYIGRERELGEFFLNRRDYKEAVFHLERHLDQVYAGAGENGTNDNDRIVLGRVVSGPASDFKTLMHLVMALEGSDQKEKSSSILRTAASTRLFEMEKILREQPDQDALEFLHSVFSGSHEPCLLFELSWILRRQGRAHWVASLVKDMLDVGQSYLGGDSFVEWQEREKPVKPQLDNSNLRCLAELLLQNGFLDTAWCVASAAPGESNDSLIVWLKATALQNRGQIDMALAELERIEDIEPGLRAAVSDTKGTLLCSLGRFFEAASELEHALALEPDRIETCCALAYCKYILGGLDEARKLAEKALKGDENLLACFLLDLFKGHVQPTGNILESPPPSERFIKSASGQKISYYFLSDQHAAAAAMYLKGRQEENNE
ncbi:MAG: radical SAM protein [Deltaproteobacteria bacterium]|nr:radical SAM protein [Deltaproteobacteria bacterium]